jgi:hypothetical protein
MDFVVNEWLSEYLRPTADKEKHGKVLFFFKALMQKAEDRIVVREPSDFLRKIHRYRKEFDYDLASREAYKFFIRTILENSEKCLQIPREGLQPLPAELLEKLGEGHSDIYLFEAAQHSDSKIIVTTDERLQDRVAGIEGFKVILLDDFLKTYSTE